MDNRNRVLTAILIAAIMSMSAGYAFALVPPTFSTVIQPGSQVAAYSYIAFTDGASFFLRNGRTGAIDTSSTNARTLLQAGFNAVFTNGGSLLIRNGTYAIGSANLTLSSGASDFSISFEQGATITYTGATYALDFWKSPRGSITDFSINQPRITTSTGSCMHFYGIYRFEIIRPFLNCKTVGIAIDDSNTGRISQGVILEIGNYRGAGTVGVRLGTNVDGGQTNQVEVNVDNIAGFQYGVQIGDTTYGFSEGGFDIHGIDLTANSVGIQNFMGQQVSIHNNWFEANTVASIQLTNPGSASPGLFEVTHNTFAESGIPCLNIPNGNYVYGLYVTANNFGGCTLILGNAIQAGTVDIYSAGTVTLSSTKVTLTFQPNPQVGNITGISSASVTVVSGSVTFPVAYPTGITPKVFLTPTFPTSASVRISGVWTSTITKTGFTWNADVTVAVGGSTFCLLWEATP